MAKKTTPKTKKTTSKTKGPVSAETRRMEQAELLLGVSRKVAAGGP